MLLCQVRSPAPTLSSIRSGSAVTTRPRCRSHHDKYHPHHPHGRGCLHADRTQFSRRHRARFKAGQYLRVKMPDGRHPKISRWPMRRAKPTAMQLHIRRIPDPGSFSEGRTGAALQKSTSSRSEIPVRQNITHRFRQADRLRCDRHRLCAAQVHHQDLDLRSNSRRARFYWCAAGRSLYLAKSSRQMGRATPWLKTSPGTVGPRCWLNCGQVLVHQPSCATSRRSSGWQVCSA